MIKIMNKLIKSKYSGSKICVNKSKLICEINNNHYNSHLTIFNKF
jgi:hypothetical protein